MNCSLKCKTFSLPRYWILITFSVSVMLTKLIKILLNKIEFIYATNMITVSIKLKRFDCDVKLSVFRYVLVFFGIFEYSYFIISNYLYILWSSLSNCIFIYIIILYTINKHWSKNTFNTLIYIYNGWLYH